MQENYTTGPVTIVQIVGLSAKPRIASVQTDAAVRAADPIPPSAAAGFGDELTSPVTQLASSFLNIKAAPALGLSADPVRSHISMESGVDRPVVDANAPAPAIDPSTFEQFLPDNSLPEPAVGPRGDALSPEDDQAKFPGTTEVSQHAAESAMLAPGDIFDGVKTFGDDQILDFTLAVDISDLAPDAAEPIMQISNDDVSSLSVYGIDDWGGFAMIDCSGCISPEPQMMNNDFVAPMWQLSATDAIPFI